jgi:hypothetical protein
VWGYCSQGPCHPYICTRLLFDLFGAPSHCQLLVHCLLASLVYAMSLQGAWGSAPAGKLAPSEQAKLWGLREALRNLGEDDDQYEWMSKRVHVVGNGTLNGGGNPSRVAVFKFFARVDEVGSAWYPGIVTKPRTGRPVEMTAQKKATIAKSMMAAKKKGDLPGYDTAMDRCPAATFNDTTGKFFSRQRVNQVLTTECYDEDPSRPWEFRFGAKRRALTAEARAERKSWAIRILKERRRPQWFFLNAIWIDLCSKVIPGSPKKAFDQLQSGRNKRKRLMSPGSLHMSTNAGGSDTAEKQCSWGDTRVWFGVVLARGVLGVTVFVDTDVFSGENPEGTARFVDRLPRLLDRMLGRNAKKRRSF